MGLGSGIVCSINLNTVLDEKQREIYQNVAEIQNLLTTSRKIAIIGLSTDRQKASYFVASYLKSAGFEIFPVHPKADEILGRRVYRSLEEIGEPVDIVDVFRPSYEVPQIVEDAIKTGARAVWQQLRINNLEAADRARKAGLVAVVDTCVKMEHGRYSGGLHESGMNTEILSARRVHRFY